MKKRLFITITTGIILLLTTSCPIPLTEDLFKKVTDEINPVIVITSPESGSSYASIVLVEGTVTDATTAAGDLGTVDSLSFSVLSTNISETVEFNDEGSFSFTFSTSGLSGSFTVQIMAKDKNGNVQTASITLVDEGAIPSFNAEPQNKSVILTWDAVPLTESYTLLYTANGSYPSDINGISLGGVTSPYTLLNLENGNLHVFQLKTVTTGGDENLSDYTSAIPLSKTTITPSVSEEYGSLTIGWNEIEGSDEYTLWRGESGNDLYSYARVAGNSFTDVSVTDGQTYFYAVSPALSDEIRCEPASGQTWPFPPSALGYGGTVSLYQSSNLDYEDGYVYAVHDSGIDIIDVTDPDNPITCSTITSPQGLDQRAVKVTGEYAYIAEYYYNAYDAGDPLNDMSAMRIYDISNSYSPELKGSCEYTSAGEKYQFSHIDVNSTHACVTLMERATSEYRIKLFNISINTNPYDYNTEVNKGEYILPAFIMDVSVEDDYAYVAVEDSGSPANSGLYILNVAADPDTPTLAGSETGNASLTKPRGLFVSNSIVYLADYFSGLRIINAANPGTLSDECTFDPGTGTGNDVKVIGNIAYIAMSSGGLYIIDISDYLNPVIIRNYEVPSAADNVEISNSYDAYVIDHTKGLRIFKINFPNNPTLQGSYDTSLPSFKQFQVVDTYAYVAAVTNGFRIVDISNPSAPTLAGSFPTPNANSVFIQGTIAFIADAMEDLVILDISDPSQPALLGSIDSGLGGNDLEVYGDYAYIAGGGSLATYNIAAPATPELVRYWDIYGGYDIERYGDNLYLLTDGAAGDLVTVFDISIPDNPVKTGVAALASDNLHYLARYENYMYATGNNHGIHIVDISSSTNPSEVNTMYDEVGIDFRGIKIAGSYAFIATLEEGLKILDLSEDPENPAEIGSYMPPDTTDRMVTVDVYGNYAYYTEIDTSDTYRSFRVLKLENQ
jgi:hypothetical protein